MVKRSFFSVSSILSRFRKSLSRKILYRQNHWYAMIKPNKKKYNSNSLETDYIIYYNNLVETFL